MITVEQLQERLDVGVVGMEGKRIGMKKLEQ